MGTSIGNCVLLTPSCSVDRMKPPPRWKNALLVWVAIYPSISLLSYFAGPWLITLPLLIRTLFLTAILVPLLVFVLLPFLHRVFREWLHR
jgi:antibiotic biosynthesis monooxygenase (ABM) superfamily enzyme